MCFFKKCFRKLQNGDLAVLALCMDESAGSFFKVSTSLESLGWKYKVAYVRDVYSKANASPAHGNLTLTLAPQTSAMVRLSASPTKYI